MDEVEIKVRDNGPYKVTGRVRLIDAEGNEYVFEDDRPFVLCRCGQSRTKPFCDSTHKEVGFESCWRVEAAARREKSSG
jgi:CDGSH iron-sulfur domain-containing protein 3